MTNKIEISRELAEHICDCTTGSWMERELRALLANKPDIVECDACPTSGGCVGKCMKAPAAPVVEHQEPFAYSFRFAGCVTASGPESWRSEIDRERPAQFLFDDGRVENFQPLYTSPPAPVAVLDERAEFVAWVRREWPQAPLSNVRDLLPKDDPRYGEYCDETLQRAWVGWQARACLDKVKELNQ